MRMLKPNFWKKKNSLISFFLLPLSLFIQTLIALQSRYTERRKSSIPVICVGNVYVGGTGKTPLSIEIVEILSKLNKKGAIVKKPYKEHADEFKLIESKRVALFKNSSRFQSINEAVKNKFDYVVLDDGYQDFSINKNLSILCFNEKQLVGNGMTLPSGPLREPFSSIKRCQIIIINGVKNLEFELQIKKISNSISIYYSEYVPTNIKQFRNKNLFAFAGIGNPENFFDLLEKNNLIITKKIAFPDHYKYSLIELEKIINFCMKNNLRLVTTEKDFFRIKHFKLPKIEYLGVKLEILDKNNFEKEIAKYL